MLKFWEIYGNQQVVHLSEKMVLLVDGLIKTNFYIWVAFLWYLQQSTPPNPFRMQTKPKTKPKLHSAVVMRDRFFSEMPLIQGIWHGCIIELTRGLIFHWICVSLRFQTMMHTIKSWLISVLIYTVHTNLVPNYCKGHKPILLHVKRV